jgi:hypothetical protein
MGANLSLDQLYGAGLFVIFLGHHYVFGIKPFLAWKGVGYRRKKKLHILNPFKNCKEFFDKKFVTKHATDID